MLDEEHPGSSLADQSTDLGAGRSVRYLDVVSGHLRHLKAMAEAQAGAPLRSAWCWAAGVLRRRRPRRGRPGPARAGPGRAQVASPSCVPVRPIAAALDYETTLASSSWCWWPTSAAAPRTSRWCASGQPGAGAPGARRRHPGQPWRACRRHRLRPPHRAGPPACPAATAAGPHRARGAQQGVLRPGHLAPDHTVYNPREWPSWQRVSCRCAAAPPPDDGGEQSVWAMR